MQVGRHHFCSESLEWLKRQVSAGSLSRSALAEGLCEREDWVNARGEFCLASARKALPVLCDRLKLPLPAPRRKFGGSAAFHYPTLESEDVLFLLLTRLICTCSNFRERTALQTLVISDSGCRLLG